MPYNVAMRSHSLPLGGGLGRGCPSATCPERCRMPYNVAMRAFLLLLLLLPLGCGKKEANPEAMTPVGSWGQWNAENAGGSPDTSEEFDYVYVFTEDGKFTATIGARVDTGTWKLEGETVKLDTGATLTLGDGKTMRGTTPSGNDVVLHRM